MRRLLPCFIALFFVFSQAQAKEPVPWHQFKANRVQEETKERLQIPKLLPQLLPEIKHDYAEWQEAWSNKLEAKEQAESFQSEPADSSSVQSLYVTGSYAIPTYIVMCESGGDYLAENAISSASGAYQIIDSSWAGYGGYYHASDAPPSVQDAKAALMWAGGAGASHWAQCL